MKLIRTSFVMAVFLFAIQKTTAQIPTPPSAADTMLEKADVPLSVRWWNDHYDTVNVPEDSTWYVKAEAFNANRLLWTYPRYESNYSGDYFPEYADDRGYQSQYAVPLYAPKDSLSMQATNLCDWPTRGTWEICWDGRRPDVNSDAFFDYQLAEIKALVDHGNIFFQQDNASMNESLYDLGGSFNQSSIEKFNDWLLSEHNAGNIDLDDIGLDEEAVDNDGIDDFNFKTYLLDILDQNNIDIPTLSPVPDPYCPSGVIDSNLLTYETECRALFTDSIIDIKKQYYHEFQKSATIDYYQRLHDSIDEYIKDKFGPLVEKEGVYTANNLEQSAWLDSSFDFWVSEVYPKTNSPGLAHDIDDTARFSRASYYDATEDETTSAITIGRDSVWGKHQVSIALAYANGLTMVAPWDVYVPNEDRFFGDPTDEYDDLYAFVENKAAYFNDYNTLEEHVHIFSQYEEVLENDTENKTGHDIVKLLRGSTPLSIPVSSKVKIGGTVFTTVAATTVGEIHLPTNSGVTKGDPLLYIDSYESGTYTRVYDDTSKSINTPDIDITTGFVTNVIDTISSPARTTVQWTDSGSITDTIPVNSKVMINDSIYNTTVKTGVGLIYLAPNTSISIGDRVWYIEDPDDEIMYPIEKPFVVTVRKKGNRTSDTISNVTAGTSPPRTTIDWAGKNDVLDIPVGSQVMINGVKYTTIVETGVGLIYLDPDTPVNIGESVWYVKNPEGDIIYPLNSYDDCVMHVVNLKGESEKVAVKVSKSRFDGPFTKIAAPNNHNFVNSVHVDNGSYYVHTINYIDKWSMLTQGQSETKGELGNNEGIPKKTDNVLIYPNPAGDMFTIEVLENPDSIEIELLNSIGQRVYKFNKAEKIIQIDVSGFASGIYFVKVRTAGQVTTKKLIKK